MPVTLSNTTKAFLLNTLLLFPTYNLGKCIGDYTVIYQRKIQCTQQKNVPKYLNCSKESKYIGDVDPEVKRWSSGLLASAFIQSAISIVLFILMIPEIV